MALQRLVGDNLSKLGESIAHFSAKFSGYLSVIFSKFGWFLFHAVLVAGLVYLLLSSQPSFPSSQCFPSWMLTRERTNSRSPFSNNFRSPTKIGHILFGIAGSSKTWRNRGPYIDLWWEPNKTRGHVWLDSPPTKYPWPSSSPPFRISENTAIFNGYNKHEMPFAIRMARVLLESFNLGLSDVRWFVMGDDDTVFFVDNLVKVLAKYDHNKYFYIGGNSESVVQNMAHSYDMAFGGGGYAVSYPLAKALSRIFDDCIRRYQTLYGSDHIIQSCVAEVGVRLTKEPGFHQIDLLGDIYGLLSAHPMSPLLSLHHLDYIAPIFPGMTRIQALKVLLKASKANPPQLLQQSICYHKEHNWSISVSWGYSVQIYQKIYPPGFLTIPLQTFKPWRKSGVLSFMFNTRPLSTDPCEKPTVFFFDSVKPVSPFVNLIETVYVGREDRSISACNLNQSLPNIVDEVRIFSELQDIRVAGSRRQCCEVLPSSGMNVTEIRIRECLDDENVAFPLL
ncbi:uncharacterized protein LOC18436258 [Amborella trichopoda]|uniref:Uncharacterized protein n=1 Tax=Amborella trichopoda TaxID=13333 RepID=W1PJ37_AMBTC|nr:uncharacterized protein LOC18436258 [Amborella trichopoda]ERN08018.1 hypothetical protein AMTR_s00012p00258210 [Amborella trichopoda]|eukprot:XP_006846343.1 uncharacterized protein LOC18436258 [Amborella trichopoda]